MGLPFGIQERQTMIEYTKQLLQGNVSPIAT
jgi:hypothetical protein